jgi:hypothetical protein
VTPIATQQTNLEAATLYETSVCLSTITQQADGEELSFVFEIYDQGLDGLIDPGFYNYTVPCDRASGTTSKTGGGSSDPFNIQRESFIIEAA